MDNLNWSDAAFTHNANRAFKLEAQSLSEYQYYRWTVKNRVKQAEKLKVYKAALKELQPIGEIVLAEAQQVCRQLQAQLKLPQGYTLRYAVESLTEKQFIAGNINTPTNLSLFFSNRSLDVDDHQQIHGEIRLFLDSPRAVLFFYAGQQHGFRAKQIEIGNNNTNWVEAVTRKDLLVQIINAIQPAFDNPAQYYCQKTCAVS